MSEIDDKSKSAFLYGESVADAHWLAGPVWLVDDQGYGFSTLVIALNRGAGAEIDRLKHVVSMSRDYKYLAGFEYQAFGNQFASVRCPEGSPPAAAAIKSPAAEKKNDQDDNQNCAHTFLQSLIKQCSLSELGMQQRRNHPRTYPSVGGSFARKFF
jgi:hypothetical protein